LQTQYVLAAARVGHESESGANARKSNAVGQKGRSKCFRSGQVYRQIDKNCGCSGATLHGIDSGLNGIVGSIGYLIYRNPGYSPGGIKSGV
jgi:hypothetical protein